MIYAVEILDREYVKFGYCKAEDAQSRVSALQTGNPFQLKLIGLTEGTLMQEKALHTALNQAFARLRVPMPPNEWYPGKIPFTRQLVEVMPLGPNQMLALADKYNPSLNRGSELKSPVLTPNFQWPTIRKASAGSGEYRQ